MLALAAGVSVGIPVGLFAGILDGIVCGFITLYAIGIAIYWITIPFTACFPAGYETVRDLVRRATPKYDAQDGIDASVLDRVRGVISEQMGVAIEKLAAQTSFAKDLHID